MSQWRCAKLGVELLCVWDIRGVCMCMCMCMCMCLCLGVNVNVMLVLT